MQRSRILGSLPLALVLGGAVTASAVVLAVVLELLTLFAIVGLTFDTYAELRAVPDPPKEVAACDVVIEILDAQGLVLDTHRARVPAGETASLQFRSRSGPGETDAIRARVRSRTVPQRPRPPGPCPILASLQVVGSSTGKTEALMLPATQRVVREVSPVP
jgi:hypothetical protein